jgi:WD40 repeat protein
MVSCSADLRARWDTSGSLGQSVKLTRAARRAGPVRGIAFHPTQPLFCSGGDDYKIKVWK